MQYRVMPVADLRIDPRYQRPVNSQRVKHMAKHFDPRKLGVLEVSLRGKKAAVFDGQHRLGALKLKGIADVPCIVHEGLTARAEAQLFVELQQQRKPLRPIDRFHARAFAGDTTARSVRKIVEDAGYGIPINVNGEAGQRSEFAAVGALERVFRVGNLPETLELMGIWRGDEKSTDGLLLAGCSLLLREAKVGAEARDLLAGTAPKVILRRATGGLLTGGGTTHVAPLVAAELRKIGRIRKGAKS